MTVLRKSRACFAGLGGRLPQAATSSPRGYGWAIAYSQQLLPRGVTLGFGPVTRSSSRGVLCFEQRMPATPVELVPEREYEMHHEAC